jgi:Xaa-Pro aminopeptidase
VLVRAQQAAVDAVRPGVTAEQVDAAARDVLAAEGLARRSCTAPATASASRRTRSRTSRPATRCRCVRAWRSASSPGSTSPGLGLRIEDIVVVTADGCTNLNTTPHELTPALD